MRYGLIGEKLGHSFSADIHKRLGYDYELCEIGRDKLDDFMRRREFRGINVTIPYKQAVIPYLDVISPVAARIGAVNTVVNRGGKLFGYNTDYSGLRALVTRQCADLGGAKVLVAGSGGTSLTAAAVATDLGADEVVRLSRTARDGCAAYCYAAKAHGDAAFLINTTPVGMFPNCEGELSLLRFEDFKGLRGVADAVFNPLRTNTVLRARENGIPAEGGLYMLVVQAVRASELFFGVSHSPDVADKIYCDLVCEKENVVLTGMPGSGKSTVGKLVAELLGRRFVDTDREIVARTGREISDVFAEKGEGEFRRIESEVIRDVAAASGTVIATGGGAVLSADNVRALRRNGKICFLDRSLCRLLPTADRPLASSAESIRRLYGERIGIYNETADVRVSSDASVRRVADEIVRIAGLSRRA